METAYYYDKQNTSEKNNHTGQQVIMTDSSAPPVFSRRFVPAFPPAIPVSGP